MTFVSGLSATFSLISIHTAGKQKLSVRWFKYCKSILTLFSKNMNPLTVPAPAPPYIPDVSSGLESDTKYLPQSSIARGIQWKYCSNCTTIDYLENTSPGWTFPLPPYIPDDDKDSEESEEMEWSSELDVAEEEPDEMTMDVEDQSDSEEKSSENELWDGDLGPEDSGWRACSRLGCGGTRLCQTVVVLIELYFLNKNCKKITS
jgi:hypothetical protein